MWCCSCLLPAIHPRNWELSGHKTTDHSVLVLPGAERWLSVTSLCSAPPVLTGAPGWRGDGSSWLKLSTVHWEVEPAGWIQTIWSRILPNSGVALWCRLILALRKAKVSALLWPRREVRSRISDCPFSLYYKSYYFLKWNSNQSWGCSKQFVHTLPYTGDL